MKDAFGVDRPDLVSKSLEGRRKVSHALSNPLVMAPVGAVVTGAPIAGVAAATNARINRDAKRVFVNDREFTRGVSRPAQLAAYKAAKVPLTRRMALPTAAAATTGAALFGGGAAAAHHVTHRGKS